MDNNYYLNGKNMTTYGIIPGQSSNSNLALSGAWDMPSRIGKTFHEWPDENGIEPYLRSDEIFFAGRDLTFTFHIAATDRNSAITKCYALYDDINAFTGLVPFSSDLYGSYQVLVNSEIKIEYMGGGYCKGTLIMREPVVNLTGATITADNIAPSIDNISLAKLGFVITSMTDQFNRPAAKSATVTAYGAEGYKINKTGARTFNLQLAGSFATYSDFSSAIQSLTALLASPNARTLIHNGITREFFAPNGFAINQMQKQGSAYVCTLTIKATEIRVLSTYNLFTDNQGNILTDGNGVPLASILKMN
jgi:hypothetical protein